MPPSSYEPGLTANPNPIDNYGNSVITGNVRGGKQFRGPVPYQSPTSLHAPLGSTQLDSFMRYTAVPEELDGYTPSYDTFYSPTGTVAKIRPGQTGVFAPTSPRVATGIGALQPQAPADVIDSAVTPSRAPLGQMSSTANASWDAGRRLGDWPLSRTPEQMNQPISSELGQQYVDRCILPQPGEAMSPEEYQRQLEEFRGKLERIKADASELEQSLKVNKSAPQDTSAQVPPTAAETSGSRLDVDRLLLPVKPPQPLPALPRTGNESLQGTLPPLPNGSPIAKPTQEQDVATIPEIGAPAPENPGLSAGPSPASAESRLRLYGQASDSVALAPDAATRANRIAELIMPQTQGAVGQTPWENPGELPAVRRVKEAAAAFDSRTESATSASKSLMGGEAAAAQLLSPLSDRVPTLGRDTRAAGAAGQGSTTATNSSGQLIGDQIRQKYADLGASSQEKFDRCIAAAESYLQQGRYYRAADSFTLASMYKPGDSRACVGKSHALFAAGEYLSSALILAQAMEMDPHQTLTRVDLVNTVGGPDLFLRRITDLEQCGKTGEAPQLQFLLAYVYYQMDRPDAAKMAIEAARKELPKSPSVALLKDAIGK
jgi:tetratricopeptide (TPR) repeat protein